MTVRLRFLIVWASVLCGLSAEATTQAPPFRSLLPRCHIPDRTEMELEPYEMILLEDLPLAIDAARENPGLEHRDCMKFASYSYNLQRLDDAVYFCERALDFAQEPRSTALETMGWIFELREEWNRATGTWADLAQETEQDIDFRLRLVHAHLKLNHVLAARTELESMRPLHPDHPRVNHLLGFCHLKLGDARQARRFFIKAGLHREPAPVALIGMSVISELENERNEALGWLKKALLAAPHYQRVEFICIEFFSAFFEDETFIHTLAELDLPSDRELALAALPSAEEERERLARKSRSRMDIKFALRTEGDERMIIQLMKSGFGASANLSLQRVAYTPPKSKYLISMWPGHSPLENLWKRVPRPPSQ